MHYLIFGLAGFSIVAIAYFFVNYAVKKTWEMPDQVVIDSHEAIEYCAQALPTGSTSTLSYDELRRLLRFHLEWVQAFHWSPGESAGRSTAVEPIVVDQYDAVEYILERCVVSHFKVDKADVVAVVEAHNSYLLSAGALHIEDPDVVIDDLAGTRLAGLLETSPKPQLDSPGPDGVTD